MKNVYPSFLKIKMQICRSSFIWIATLCLNAFFCFSANHVAAQTLYAISGSSGSPSILYRLDPSTGALVSIVGATGYTHITGIDIHPTTGAMYGYVSTGVPGEGGGSGFLVSIDINTGLATPVGDVTNVHMSDLSFSPAGVLYGWGEREADGLYMFDLSTGAATRVGDCNCGSTQRTGIAFDNNGNLYMKTANSLLQLDPVTATEISRTVISSPVLLDNILEFDENNVLYTGSRRGGGFTLLTIDIPNATASVVGGNPTSNISAIAFNVEVDTDSDDDGIANTSDNCPSTPNADQTNTDQDAQGDACDDDDDNDTVNDSSDNCSLISNTDQANTDGDSQGDVCDPDDDNDAANDSNDNCPFVSNADQANADGDAQGDVCDPDDDNDTVNDSNDNCPFVSNTNQANADGDSQGDVCDPDDDNDTVNDSNDNCPFVSNTNQANADGDAQGDVCDPDDDNDTVNDSNDNCPFVSNTNQTNTDGDAQGNACDTDDDGDGTPDSYDCEPLNKKNHKVLVCHNGHVICIDENGWENGHSKHKGDYLGPCLPGSTSDQQDAMNVELEEGQKGLLLKAFPNPTSTYFTLTLKSLTNEKIQVKVFDLIGREVFSANGTVNETYKFGEQFSKGTYLVRVLQAGKQASVKLSKQ